ncbi:MAG: biotin--[acetyl-CoA-carboxylase] ligase [Chloroflexi bacterium]|nr:biotin--[acetyl-CoA-carboxylase] ligase [Chloroflexota bacterium]|tara:strand:+ start:194 stop:973 length:780 start_codon:yes stop_codon:yes gene_type:complete
MKNRLEHLKGNFNNFGKEVFFVDTTDSTMTLAWDYIDTEKSGGALIFTDYQTQGKGRYNRKWISQPKKDLLLSLTFKPPTNILNQLLMIASLSVYDLLISLDLRPQIKWPNDVLVNGKKIAGTIAESRIISQKFSYAVIGIGVNVNLLVDESSPIINTYTSIYKEKKVEYDRYELLKILLLNLDDYYSYILSGKNIIPKWKDKIMNIGKNIKISFTNKETANYISGKAIDIDDEGMIVILDENMKEWHVSSGEVTVIST